VRILGAWFGFMDENKMERHKNARLGMGRVVLLKAPNKASNKTNVHFNT
jgi:hypothetical protein